jgi:DNA-binding NtrC family response regulator
MTLRDMPVLVVDDDRMALAHCEIALQAAGVERINLCNDPRDATARLAGEHHALVFVDLDMPHIGGEALLAEWTQRFPELPVIIVTGSNDIETAVRCMRNGAFDYVLKPIEDGRVASALHRALEMRELRDELSTVKQRLLSGSVERPEVFASIVTRDTRMEALFRYTEAIAVTNRPVLITGETGSGKELMARAIHELSGRKGPFVAVNISGLDDALFSDMLFGHLKGAYTGAANAMPGLIEKAAGGTLFLDEIGDLSTVSQVKLLRLIQEREYFPLGANTPKKTDARIVVATLRDLEAAQKEDGFRRDLYYRLQTHRVHIPPLRERMDDLPMLLDHFLVAAARDLNTTQPTPPPGLLDLLATYPFPGNIRELESMVFDAVSNHRGGMLAITLFKEHIARHRSLASALPVGAYTTAAYAAPPAVPAQSATSPDAEADPENLYRGMPVLPTIRTSTDALIAEALRRAKNNQALASELLGIAPSSLNKRLKRAEAKTADEFAL